MVKEKKRAWIEEEGEVRKGGRDERGKKGAGKYEAGIEEGEGEKDEENVTGIKEKGKQEDKEKGQEGGGENTAVSDAWSVWGGRNSSKTSNQKEVKVRQS